MSQGDKANAVVQDTAECLGQIRDANAYGQSIISATLDYQRHAITRSNWLKSLECLYLATDHDGEPSGKRQRLTNGDSVPSSYSPELLRRTYLDPVSDPSGGREYVAISYTWDLSEDEYREDSCHSFGGYFIESRETGEPAQPSNVRDVVWQRAFSYAHQWKCDHIWIDRECVDQDNPKEKEVAIQNMHLVYSMSRHPIALLTHVIGTAEELDLLAGLLTGDVREEEKPALLHLLHVITSDLWWQRAWTFQEDYRASTRMTLLIPHTFNLELHKQSIIDIADPSNRPLFGRLPQEICIRSTDFRACATEFCLRYMREEPGAAATCNKIIRTAGKYNVLLRQESLSRSYPMISRSMTPTILADIDRRGISMQSDRLAIAANCCGYNTRLDTASLNRHNCSLSLSILALYLLNGEMLENHPRLRRGTLEDNIYMYLAKQSIDSFRPPDDKELTFIKSCRFVEPVLTLAGTRTQGHLWRLGKIIRPQPLRRNKYRTLSPLATLATDLQYRKYGASYTELATALQSYALAHSGRNRSGTQRHRYHGRHVFTRPRQAGWAERMAEQVESALLEGKALRLASLIDPENPDEYSPYTAVFVGEDRDDWLEEEDEDEDDDSETAGTYKETYAFTSVRLGKPHSLLGGSLTRHVSLEVEVEWPDGEGAFSDEGDRQDDPGFESRGERWLNGLCFSNGFPHQPVLFPWPEDLEETDTAPHEVLNKTCEDTQVEAKEDNIDAGEGKLIPGREDASREEGKEKGEDNDSEKSGNPVL
ncbi:hypothetical protein F5Y17DRAFT_465542 [Xylariaceae sp. FL0594]|nr:hypothetical protein F5Y17DRAFT_465542 [Xylariaceae sp. FL0594]